MTSTHGAVSWFEIATGNAASAQEFYGALFGWRFQADGDTSRTHNEITTHGGPRTSGGLMATGGEMPSYATICIRVDDITALLARATGSGAQVVAGPFPAGNDDAMTIAYLLDPQGAMTCVWQTSAPEEFAPYGDIAGAVGWFEIGARDVDAAQAYYADVFGWRFEATPGGGGRDYRIISTGEGHPLRGGLTTNERAPYAVFCVVVTDVDATCAAAEGLGGKVLAGPMHPVDAPATAYLLDREGSQFGVFTPAS